MLSMSEMDVIDIAILLSNLDESFSQRFNLDKSVVSEYLEKICNTKTTFYGESKCIGVYKSGKLCTNNGYYLQDGQILCGLHSDKNKRDILPKNPNAEKLRKEEIELHNKSVRKAQIKNKNLGKSGDLIVSSLKMMGKPETIEGFLKVYPNFKHQNRQDGFGCASLSPKSLGPVKHGMPNLPIAKNVENYHQFAKIYEVELSNGKITKESMQTRINGYNDSTPHRHKFLKMKPNFSVFYSKKGVEKRYNYIECRYFYCYWYRKLVEKKADFKKLQQMLRDGYNLQIIGYDGYPITKSLYEHYIDPAKPFGHELVLYSLLVGEYPWEIYREKYPDKYIDMF